MDIRMTMRRWTLSLCIIACSITTVAQAADGTDKARGEVNAAIQAMGGEAVLKSVHSIQYSAVGHRNMLEIGRAHV